MARKTPDSSYAYIVGLVGISIILTRHSRQGHKTMSYNKNIDLFNTLHFFPVGVYCVQLTTAQLSGKIILWKGKINVNLWIRSTMKSHLEHQYLEHICYVAMVAVDPHISFTCICTSDISNPELTRAMRWVPSKLEIFGFYCTSFSISLNVLINDMKI